LSDFRENRNKCYSIGQLPIEIDLIPCRQQYQTGGDAKL